jgi:DHA1 family multidrug resistance protein-like MFS transporter
MNYWKKNLFFLWISQLFVMSGLSAAMPFVPLFIKYKFNIVEEGKLGVAISLFTFFGLISFGIMAPVWGMLADKYGRKIMLFRASFMNAAIFPLMAFAPNLFVLILIRAVASAFSGTTTAAQALIVSTTPEDKQGFALSVLSTAVWSGHMIGYVLGGILVNYFGFTTAFLLCSILYVTSGLLIFFVQEDFKPVVQNTKKSGKKSFKMERVLLLLLMLFFLICFLRNLESPYLAVLVSNLTGDDKAAFWTGIISASAAVGGIISGVLFGYFTDKCKPMQLLTPSLLLFGVTLMMQGAAKSVTALIVARFFAYMAIGGAEPVLQTLLSKITPGNKRAAAFGYMSSARNAGMISSSLVAGGIIYFSSVRGVFYISAVAFWLLIPFMGYIIRLIYKLKARELKVK